ncbi:MAG: glycoside hydrolase N-terminal domain-containing protein, partial [Lachnospiraceae bacterium]|nr:glycoside hydrolase N-terminal domain-containing protein [Lachnospiraceae bacterium]
MKKRRVLAAVMAAITLVSSAGGLYPAATVQATTVTAEADENDELRLWYKSEAPNNYNGWMTQSLPLGNSSIGASVFGGVAMERIQLTEKSLWSGGPSENRSTTASSTFGNLENVGRNGQLVKEIQEAFAAGDTTRANNLCGQLVGVSSDNGIGGYGYFLSYGNMYLDFKNADGSAMAQNQASEYVRDLDLNTAIAGVEYDYNNVHYTRENFVSYPDEVLVTKVTASTPGSLNMDVRVETEKVAGGGGNNNQTYQREDTTTIKDGRITIAGKLTDNQMKYHSQTQVIVEGGTRADGDGKVVVEDATSVIIITAMGTDYKNEYPNYRTGETDEQLAAEIKSRVDAAQTKGYDALKETHVDDYQSLFHRMILDLGQVKSDRPTNEMLTAYNNGTLPEEQRRMLEVVLHQYGRYMTIASSRGDTLPSNLQGIWAGGNCSPWHSDYHINVNLQMNYWPTYSGNLAECALPLINYIDSMREPGRITAKIYNGVESKEGEENGFVFHTQCTPFGWTGPGWSFDWGWSPAAVPWILQNCWEHFEYTGDLDYMRENIYPMMKESVKFYKAILIEDPDDPGKLVSSPAYSPEHGPRTNGNTYEQTLVWQLLEDTITAGELVGEDEATLAEWQEIQDNLKGPIEIGESGQIKEWYHETTVNSLGQGYGHRHISHMLGLFPGDLISVDTPDLLEAAIVSMNSRTDASTGWGMGQRINTWARIGDGNRTYKLIGDLFRSGMYQNLWDAHPPFQIDGNFGYTSGVNEMLMQSNMNYINLLPALPDVWDSGSVQGILARGNFELDFTWENKALTSLTVESKNGGTAVLQHEGISFAKVLDSEGQPVEVTVVKDNKISFETEKGETYTVEEFKEILAAPTGLAAERIASDSVELSWDASEVEGISYKIYRTINNGDKVLLAENVTGNSYKDEQDAHDFRGDFVYQIIPVVDGESGQASAEVVAVDLRGIGMIDDRDSRVVYTGGWGDWTEAVNYAGTIKFLENPNGTETASLTFVGTGIEVFVCNNRDRGKYEVSIDGTVVGEIDTYNAATQRQHKAFTKTDLDYGKHTIVLRATATKNDLASRAKVELDAFNVLDNTRTGATGISVESVSGLKVVGKANGTLQMKATVTPAEAADEEIVWSVTNTSGAATTLATISQEGLLTVGETNGTVRVTATSKSNSAVSGSMDINIILPGTAQYTDVQDATNNNNGNNTDGPKNENLTWEGTWSVWEGEPNKHGGGTKTESSTTGSSISYEFQGSAIAVYAHKNSNCGSFKIYIDDELQQNSEGGNTFSLAANDSAQQEIYRWDVPEGDTQSTHTIKLEVAENKSVNLDFFRVYAATEGAEERAALLEEIAKHTTKTERGYTPDTWTAFKAAYDAAVEEANKETANAEQLTAKKTALQQRATALQEKALDPIDVSGANLQAVGIETKSLYLKWNLCEYAQSYDVYQGETKLGSTTTGNYYVENLSPDTEYTFVVKAVDEKGGTTDITMNPVTTKAEADVEAPAQITTYHTEQQTVNSILITWDAVEDNVGVTAYHVYVDGTKVYSGTECSYELENMAANQVYGVRIIAEDAAGNRSVPTAMNLTCHAVVGNIYAVEAVNKVEAVYGTAFESLDLPETVTVVLNTEDGEKVNLAVTWAKGEYNGEKAGVYTLEGTITTTDEIQNINGIKATIQVEVKEGAAVDYTALQKAITAAEKLTLTNYQNGTEKTAFTNALSAAKKALSDKVNQAAANAAAQALTNAQKALKPIEQSDKPDQVTVDYTTLQNAITAAGKVNLSKYQDGTEKTA